MKQSKLLLLACCLCYSIVSFAQRPTYLSIDGQNKLIENLVMQDSIGGGRTHYTASFTLSLNSDPALLSIINSLQKGSTTLSFFYTRGTTATERQYPSATVLQAAFTSLNAASSRDPWKMEVTIRSLQVSEKTPVTFNDKSALSTAVLSSSFAASFDNLPTARIVSITGLQLKNNALLRVEIAAADLAGWQKWMSSPGKKIDGKIALLAPNLRDQLMLINLSNVEITGLTQTIPAAGLVERFTVLLRVGAVSIDGGK